METEKLIKLMKEFSNSNLSSLSYKEGNIHIKLKNKKVGVNGSNNKETSSLHVDVDNKDINQAINKESFNEKSLEAQYKVANMDEQTDEKETQVSKIATTEIESKKHTIKSPTVGTFYSSSSPESDPFIQVGDVIKKGQVIGIVEAMKVMNEIESPIDAIVEETPVKDEEMVEFGQALVVLTPLAMVPGTEKGTEKRSNNA